MHLSPKSHLHNIYTNNFGKAAKNIFTYIKNAKQKAVPAKQEKKLREKNVAVWSSPGKRKTEITYHQCFAWSTGVEQHSCLWGYQIPIRITVGQEEKFVTSRRREKKKRKDISIYKY